MVGVLRATSSITRPNEGIPPDAIDFTVWSAQLESTSRIVVMLEQPANVHPYHLSQEITFSSCPTLVALNECLKSVSCGSLTLDSLTIFDSLPYARKKDLTTSKYRLVVKNHVISVLQVQRPSAVLCM